MRSLFLEMPKLNQEFGSRDNQLRNYLQTLTRKILVEPCWLRWMLIEWM